MGQRVMSGVDLVENTFDSGGHEMNAFISQQRPLLLKVETVETATNTR
jgi:hypothetical protein